MNSQSNWNADGISLRNSAIVAGIGLILMAILAPIANFSILQNLIVADDAAGTVSNIFSAQGSFRMAIAIFAIVAVLDIIVAWGLYVLLRPVNKSLSLLTAWFRIVYAAMLGFVLVNLLSVLQLAGNADYLTLFGSDQISGMVMLSLSNFNTGWQLSLIIFGFHLLLLGYLLFKAGYMRKVLGILLVIAALGYLTDGFATLLSPGYDISISAFTFIGEIVLIFWLLITGGKNRSEISKND